MRFCEDPDVLNILYIVLKILNVAVIMAIVILVIMIILNIIKSITSSDVDTKKLTKNISQRVIATFIVFLIPSVFSLVFNLVGESFDAGSCIDNANKDYISYANANKADEYLKMAKQNLNEDAIYKAKKYTKKILDDDVKIAMENSIASIEQYITDIKKSNTHTHQTSSGGSVISNLNFDGYSKTGVCPTAQELSAKQPNPDCALKLNKLNTDNFIYPTNKGYSLGAWPKNYQSMSNLSITKKYQNGVLIWPVTPHNESYDRVYEHGGIDIKASIGTPVYAPASGTLRYSEWGHTDYTHGNETAYTVTIFMDTPVEYSGKKYDTIFLTHMSGITDYCKDRKCNKKVKQGELIGYVGTANGVPHLHMSFYIRALGYSKSNISTKGIESLYSVNCQGCSNQIKAGG